MLSGLIHHISHDPVYSQAWAERPEEAMAYLMYATPEIELMLRRRFPLMFTVDSAYNAVRYAAEAGGLIRPRPWLHGVQYVPIISQHVQQLIDSDYRYSSIVPVSTEKVAEMCRIMTGFSDNRGYRRFPTQFGQFRNWDFDDPAADTVAINMIDAEAEWRINMLRQVEAAYYGREVADV